MKPLALAFLISALAPALPAAAQADSPSGTATDIPDISYVSRSRQFDPPSGTATDTTPPADDKKSGAPPPSTDLVNGSPTKMGYSPGQQLTAEQQKTVDERKGKVMDGGGQLTDFSQATKDLSPGDRSIAEAAMNHGLTPVIVGGKIMGYDDPIGQVDWLPDAVAKQFANEAKAPGDPTPGTSAPDQNNVAAMGAEAQQQHDSGRVPKPGDPDFIGPLLPSQQGGGTADTCATNPHPPCANAGNQPPPPGQQIALGLRTNDFNILEAGLNDQRQQEQQDQHDATDAPGGGTPLAGRGTDTPAAPAPGFNSMGAGPSPIGAGPGGQPLGQDGRIGSNGGGPNGGTRQYASVHDEAASLMAFNDGLKNGPLQGERDPNAHSVFETVTSFINGHGGHAFMQALGLNNDATHAVAETATGNDPNASGTDDGGSYHAGKGFDGAGEVRPTQQADHLCETSKPGAFCWNRTTSTPHGTPD